MNTVDVPKPYISTTCAAPSRESGTNSLRYSGTLSVLFRRVACHGLMRPTRHTQRYSRPTTPISARDTNRGSSPVARHIVHRPTRPERCVREEKPNYPKSSPILVVTLVSTSVYQNRFWVWCELPTHYDAHCPTAYYNKDNPVSVRCRCNCVTHSRVGRDSIMYPDSGCFPDSIVIGIRMTR
jgi:hypothetical protein